MSVVLRKPPDADLWRAAHAGEDVHEMDGVAFESLISVALREYGYEVDLTERYDRGADIVATRDGRRTSIQVKRASQSVAEDAVVQAVRGMSAYECTHAMVITNSLFTPGARRHAEELGVVLWDHEDLANLLHATGIAPLTSASAPRCSSCATVMEYTWRPRPSWRCAGCDVHAPYRRWALRVTARAYNEGSPLPLVPPSPPERRSAPAPAKGGWLVELKHGTALAALVFGWMCVVAAGVAMLEYGSPTQSTQRGAVLFLLALLAIPTAAGTRKLYRARQRLRGVQRTRPAMR
jgi:hypothetical protein